MASKESVAVLSVATAFALVASPFDDNLTYSASCSTFLQTTFEPWARVAGQEWLLGSGAVVTYAIGRAFDRPRVAAVGGDLIESQIVAGVSTLAVKMSSRRTRPDGEPDHFLRATRQERSPRPRWCSVTSVSRARSPPIRRGVLITGARLQANSHYSTDLIMGAAIGILSGRAATFELGSKRVQLSPTAMPGGFAVTGTIQLRRNAMRFVMAALVMLVGSTSASAQTEAALPPPAPAPGSPAISKSAADLEAVLKKATVNAGGMSSSNVTTNDQYRVSFVKRDKAAGALAHPWPPAFANASARQALAGRLESASCNPTSGPSSPKPLRVSETGRPSRFNAPIASIASHTASCMTWRRRGHRGWPSRAFAPAIAAPFSPQTTRTGARPTSAS